MATRGWQDVTMADVTRRSLTNRATSPQAKRSKYGAVKTTVDGIVFDSKREADRYLEHRVRLKAGEIRDLRVQVSFPLYCPADTALGAAIVASYRADFVYEEHDGGWGGVRWAEVVEDVKGVRTALYRLKKKWLELQDGIVIREV